MAHGRKSIRRLDAADVVASDTTGESGTEGDAASVGISLEDLGNAFADAMRVERPTLHRESEPISVAVSQHASEESIVTPATILEAALFVGTRSGEPVEMASMLQVLKDFSQDEIVALIAGLNEEYEKNGHAIQIVAQGTGFAMRLANGLDDIHSVLASSVRETQLNQNAIDCLALVAYQPGISKESIEQQWGQPAGQVLSFLVRRGLLRMDTLPGDKVGEAEEDIDQRNKRYFTTDRFLEILGVDSLDDLPRGDEL